MARIEVDVREQRVIGILHSEGVLFDQVPLALGDVRVSLPARVPQEEPELELLLERKALDDLAASVSDGRYSDQKARILAWLAERPQHRAAMYVVERRDWRFAFPQRQVSVKSPAAERQQKTTAGCVLNTCVRDGVPVLLVADVEETCAVIAALASRVAGYAGKLRTDCGRWDGLGIVSAPSVAAGPKQQVRVNAVKVASTNSGADQGREALTQCLCVLPGISRKKAEAIVAATDAGCLREFVQRYSESPAELQRVPGVGPKLAATIHASFLAA